MARTLCCTVLAFQVRQLCLDGPSAANTAMHASRTDQTGCGREPAPVVVVVVQQHAVGGRPPTPRLSPASQRQGCRGWDAALNAPGGKKFSARLPAASKTCQAMHLLGKGSGMIERSSARSSGGGGGTHRLSWPGAVPGRSSTPLPPAPALRATTQSCPLRGWSDENPARGGETVAIGLRPAERSDGAQECAAAARVGPSAAVGTHSARRQPA